MMGDGYALPFQATEEITSLALEIGQYAGSATAFEALHPNPALRRTDREGLIGTLGITQRKMEHMIAKLKREGSLIRHGASKNGFWEVVKKEMRSMAELKSAPPHSHDFSH